MACFTRVDAQTELLTRIRVIETWRAVEPRAILEGATAALASARMTDEQRRTLSRRLEALDAASTADELLEATSRFTPASPPAHATW